MSLKLDTKQDKESSPFAMLGKDVEKSLKKKRGDTGDGSEADPGLAALAGGPSQAASQEKSAQPGQSKDAAAAAASVMSHFSDAPQAETQAKSTAAPPKLARPYNIPKPSPSQLRFKKRGGAGVSDDLDDGGDKAKAKEGEAEKADNKEQAFS